MSVKLNSDGSCIQGRCGGGGLIRNSFGNLLFSYCINLGPGMSNIAKMVVLLFGLKWCANRGFSKVWVETNSMLLAKCINKDWDTQ
ncbi:hypothetical protein KY289_023471 [Solanum tuberosum]|nr:hypothetical protein KY289_023471 [Solanum tuberosum]